MSRMSDREDDSMREGGGRDDKEQSVSTLHTPLRYKSSEEQILEGEEKEVVYEEGEEEVVYGEGEEEEVVYGDGEGEE
jgi:hypothetical protein